MRQSRKKRPATEGMISKLEESRGREGKGGKFRQREKGGKGGGEEFVGRIPDVRREGTNERRGP